MLKPPIIPNVPLSAVTTSGQELINAWKAYVNTRESEVTKREQIKANRDIALARIQSQAEILQSLIQGTFLERSKNFDNFFTLLESGFASYNDQQINTALTLIVEQIKANPMAQAVQMINKINDPNNDEIIEI